MTNDANESFLIPAIDPYNRERRRPIEKAEYRISQQFRGKKLIKTDTIQEIAKSRDGSPEIYQFGDIESIVSISIPFYEQLCNDIKGKDVLLVFHKNGFNDAVSGKMLKSTFVSSGYYDEYIAKYEGRSGNGQILYLIRQCIRDFESKHGEIPFNQNQE